MSMDELNGRAAALGLVHPRIRALANRNSTDYGRGVLDATDIILAEAAHVFSMQQDERKRLEAASKEAVAHEQSARQTAELIMTELMRYVNAALQNPKSTINVDGAREALADARAWLDA